MDTIQELLDETIKKVLPAATKQEKENYEKIMLNLMQNSGQTLSDTFGIHKEGEDSIYTYAYQLYDSGKYKDALLIFCLLSNLDPDSSRYFFAIAACYHMLKQYEKAIGAYMAAYYLDIKNPMPFYHLSDCYLKLKQLDYALFSLSMVIQIAGNDPQYAKLKERAQLTQSGIWNEREKSTVKTTAK